MQNEKQHQILEQYKEEIEKIEQRYLDLFKKGEKGIEYIGQKGGSTRNAGYRAKREYLIIELLDKKQKYDITPTFAKKIIKRIIGRKVDFYFLIKMVRERIKSGIMNCLYQRGIRLFLRLNQCNLNTLKKLEIGGIIERKLKGPGRLLKKKLLKKIIIWILIVLMLKKKIVMTLKNYLENIIKFKMKYQVYRSF